MNERKFLGKGFKFPIQVNKATGRFLMSEKETSVKESIYIILMTQKTERWTHLEFGSRVLSYTFMDTSLTQISMMAREVEETILEQEPRVRSVDVNVEPHLEKGCLLVYIAYVIAETNTRDNMVFPFYLYSDTGVETDESQRNL